MADPAAAPSSKPKAPAIRIFTSAQKYSNAPLALGRNHSSWFIVFARPYGMRGKRADLCLNYVTTDARTVSAPLSTAGRKLTFSVGGAMGAEALELFSILKDKEGRPMGTVVQRYGQGRADGVLAEVQVDVSDAELAYACAHCGKWEVGGGPRFSRCGGCRGRYYCSKVCQKEDWKPQLHKSECALLRDGKSYEVERRRKLHDNDWFMSGMLDSVNLDSSMRGEYPYMDALDNDDRDFLGYGERKAPRKPRTGDLFLGPEISGRPNGRALNKDSPADRMAAKTMMQMLGVYVPGYTDNDDENYEQDDDSDDDSEDEQDTSSKDGGVGNLKGYAEKDVRGALAGDVD